MHRPCAAGTSGWYSTSHRQTTALAYTYHRVDASGAGLQGKISSRAGVVAVDTTWVTIAASETVAQARGGCVEHWRAPGSNAAIAKVRTPVPIESDHTHARTARVPMAIPADASQCAPFCHQFFGGLGCDDG